METPPDTTRRWFSFAFASALLANLYPLTAKYLPFIDLPAHMGHVGILRHALDPAAQTSRYFLIDVRLLPTIWYETFGCAAGRFMPIPVASNLYLALFVVAGLPLAFLYALRAAGRDERLSLLAFPLIYHRAVWLGFVDFAAGIVVALVGVALAARLLDQWRPGGRPPWRRLALLSAVAFFAVLAHFFAAAWLFFAALLLLGLRRPPRRDAALFLGALGPGALVLGRWLIEKALQVHRSEHALIAGHGAVNPPWHSARLFYEWTLRGFANPLDELVLAGLVASLVLIAAWSLRRRSAAPRDGWTRRFSFLLAATVIAFFLLPMEFFHPNWWAVCVRLVIPIWFLAILALPRPTIRAPFWMLLPAWLAAVSYGVYFGYDVHRWYMGQEMAGFDGALDDLPPGQRVLALLPDYGAEHHYARRPFGHIADYYMVRRGGYALPMLDNVLADAWVEQRSPPPMPGWGLASLFSWSRHAHHYDYFLVKDPPDGPPLDPFRDAPRGGVAPVSRHGLWRVYRRLQ